MDITDAFTTGAIETSGTNVDGEIEDEVREIIRNIYVTNEIEGMEAGDQHEDIAVLCFVAGRTYQAHEGSIRINMSPDLLSRYLEFLTTSSSKE